MSRISAIGMFCLFAILAGSSSSYASGGQGMPQLTEDGNYWYLSSQQLKVTVLKKTGTIYSLKSLQPTEMDIQSPNKRGMSIYMWNKDKPWYKFMNVASGFKVERVSGGVCLKGRISFSKPEFAKVAQADVSYTLYNDRLDISVAIRCKQTDKRRYQIGVRSLLKPKQWTRQIYPRLPYKVISPSESAMLRYSISRNDDTKSTNRPLSYPFGVMERKDRFLFWGSMDLGRFVALAPNNYRGSIPSFCVNPTGIEKGKVYRFDYRLKVFPKPKNRYTEVLRWYATHMYSSDPFVKEVIAAGVQLLRQRIKSRYTTTTDPGNFNIYHWGHSRFAPWEPGFYRKMEDAFLAAGITNIVLMPWSPWDEVYPTKGSWYTQETFSMNAKGFRDEIKRLQKKGFKVYLYFRQFLTEEGTFSDKPPYKRWLNRLPDGKFMAYVTASPTRPDIAEGYRNNFGHKSVTWGFADFGHDDFRQWYMKMVKDCVDYYDPDGIYWDMGWGCDRNSINSASRPESNNPDGILKVQYEMYKWLKKKYPQKHITANEVGGTPSQIWADLVFIETPIGKSDIDFEAAHAFNTGLGTFDWPWHHFKTPFDPKQYRRAVVRSAMRGMSLGAAWSGAADSMRGIMPHSRTKCPWFDSRPGFYDGIVQVRTLTAISGISAKINALQFVGARGVFQIRPADGKITGSLWVQREGSLLAVVYNDKPEPADVVLTISRPLLRKYYGYTGSGEITLTVVSVDGKLTKRTKLSWGSEKGEHLVIQKRLGPRESLVVEGEGAVGK